MGKLGQALITAAKEASNKEFSIVPFRYRYLSSLLDMLNSQKYLCISEINMKNLPKIGYIVLFNGHPIAAGFLRRVEGGYAQFDTLVSNPYFGSKIRHEGIDLVVETLLQEAKTLKLKGIIALTSEPTIVTRAKDKDFKVVEQTLLVRCIIK